MRHSTNLSAPRAIRERPGVCRPRRLTSPLLMLRGEARGTSYKRDERVVVAGEAACARPALDTAPVAVWSTVGRLLTGRRDHAVNSTSASDRQGSAPTGRNPRTTGRRLRGRPPPPPGPSKAEETRVSRSRQGAESRRRQSGRNGLVSGHAAPSRRGASNSDVYAAWRTRNVAIVPEPPSPRRRRQPCERRSVSSLSIASQADRPPTARPVRSGTEEEGKEEEGGPLRAVLATSSAASPSTSKSGSGGRSA